MKSETRERQKSTTQEETLFPRENAQRIRRITRRLHQNLREKGTDRLKELLSVYIGSEKDKEIRQIMRLLDQKLNDNTLQQIQEKLKELFPTPKISEERHSDHSNYTLTKYEEENNLLLEEIKNDLRQGKEINPKKIEKLYLPNLDENYELDLLKVYLNSSSSQRERKQLIKNHLQELLLKDHHPMLNSLGYSERMDSIKYPNEKKFSTIRDAPEKPLTLKQLRDIRHERERYFIRSYGMPSQDYLPQTTPHYYQDYQQWPQFSQHPPQNAVRSTSIKQQPFSNSLNNNNVNESSSSSRITLAQIRASRRRRREHQGFISTENNRDKQGAFRTDFI